MPRRQDPSDVAKPDAFTLTSRKVPEDPSGPGPLRTDVVLSVGMLFYRDRDEHRTPHHCAFQFNPTELERSRTIAFTRSPTGNILEETRVGGRNAAKRKQTRKPEPWEMSMTLRFDAGYGMIGRAQPSPLRETPRSGAIPPNITQGDTARDPMTATYAQELKRIDETIQFFEQIANAQPWAPENEKAANADETPPPPYVMLAFGQRVWECAVKNVRIKEEDYTPDLAPRRFEVTLGLEILMTVPQNNQKQGTKK